MKLWLLGGALFVLGCGDRGSRDTFAVPIPNWREAGPGSPAARVTEKDNPSDRRTPEQIAADTELLAAEAESRGLAKSYGVQRALRIAVAKLTIDGVFRPTTDPSKLTDEDLELAFKQNYWHFNKPPFVSLAHLLFHANNAKKEPGQIARAARLCESALDAARQAKSAEAFRALKEKFSGRGLPIIHEEFRTWPGKLETTFEDVAFKMRTPGEVSGCVPSTYGAHIIFLYGYEPGAERTFASVKEDVRKKSADDFAARKFALWMKKLRADHRASMTPDIMARLQKEPPR